MWPSCIHQKLSHDFDLLGLNVETYENSEDNAWLSSSGSTGVIVVEVQPNSNAEKNNIHRGDIIIEMGKIVVIDITDYESELETYKKDDTIMLRLLRNSNPFYNAFEIE